MDYIKLIDEIIKKLTSGGFESDANEISDLKDTAFTSSEILLSVSHTLIIKVKGNSSIDKIIGSDVKELKDYCKSIGLEIK